MSTASQDKPKKKPAKGQAAFEALVAHVSMCEACAYDEACCGCPLPDSGPATPEQLAACRDKPCPPCPARP